MGIIFSTTELYILLGIVALTLALHLILTRTWFGRAVRAVTQDPVGARLCGVRAGTIHAATVAFGSAIVAVAGVLYTLNYPINPYEGFALTVKAFTIIILGGIGSLPGALLAGIFLGVAEALTGFFWARNGRRALDHAPARDPGRVPAPASWGGAGHERAGPSVSASASAALVSVCGTRAVLGGAYLTTFVFTMLFDYVVAQSWDWLGGEAGYVKPAITSSSGLALTDSRSRERAIRSSSSLGSRRCSPGRCAALLTFRLFRLRGDYFAFATLWPCAAGGDPGVRT